MRAFLTVFAIAFCAMASPDVHRLPLRFETTAGGLLVSHDGPYGVVLSPGSMTVVRDRDSVTARIVGADLGVRPQGVDPLAARANYLLGADAAHWRIGAPIFERAIYRSIYRGIDLVFHGSGGNVEYDFRVAPGADPRCIALEISGASALRIDADGSLAATTPSGEIRWKRPEVYQLDGGARQPVAGRFQLRGHRVTFALGRYDRSRELVIDPVLVYGTYLGGNDNDATRGIAVDASGNFYVTGYTFSTNLQTSGSVLQSSYHGGTMQADIGGDAFVAKYAASGALVYLTYLGGSGDDIGAAIAVDSSGNAYITGSTASSNFPKVGGYPAGYSGGGGNPMLTTFGDAFVAKLNPAGTALVYSLFLGGAQDDKGTAIAVDSAGNAYVGGTTLSANFPTRNPAFSTYKGVGGQPSLGGGAPLLNNGDGFVAKINAAGSDLAYSTYLGGSLDDSVTSIAIDPSGNAYVGGATLSKDFPVAGAFQAQFAGAASVSAQPVILTGDGFVTKLDATGKVSYSTYLGGPADDAVMGIAVDSAGEAYVAGFTSSSNLPGVAAGLQKTFKGPATVTGSRGFVWGDGFAAKLTSTGSLAWTTYLGGSNDDAAMAIALDAAGNAYVGGFTNSNTDFPLTADAIQHTYGGTRPAETDDTGDAFIAKISADGKTLLYSSYFGGTYDETIAGVALDAQGSVYVTGGTTSRNLPVTTNAAQRTFAGEDGIIQTESVGESFVAVFSGLGVVSPSITSVLNGATQDNRLSPGTAATVLGSNLPTDVSAGAKLGSQSITASFASATQWNVFIPTTASAGATTIQIGTSAPFNITLAAYAPALFTVAGSSGIVVGTHAGGGSISAASPAIGGETIQVSATGLGAGTAPITVTVGGAAATNVSATAGKDGIWQVTLTLPGSLAAGNQPVVLSVGGANSNTVSLPVGAVTGPVITAVQNGATFQAGIVANSWLTIRGVNLASQTDSWNNAIVNGQLPTSLDGVSVSVGGMPAYVNYISPTQINVVAPNLPAGPAAVTVTNQNVTTPAFASTASVYGPGFFLLPGNYAVATHQDYSLAVKNGTFSVTTVAAKPGDVIILWGAGFGPTSPSAPVGQLLPVSAFSSASPVTVTFTPVAGGPSTSATVYGAAMAPSYAALYQVAIQVPSPLADGDYSVVATVSGASSPVSTLLTVQN